MTISPQRELDSLIAKIDEKGLHPTLLLHACCAPCASAVLEKLNPHFDITIIFYNPNIMPKEEFILRFDAMKSLLSHYPKIKVILGEWNNDDYLDKVCGYEKQAEGGARCGICFSMRLRKTAELAKDFDYFATTLTLSPHKNAELINEIGEREAKHFGSNYLPSDFKKQNGYLRSIELSHEYNLYRQNYCGCKF
ncbi:MAG TPA: epoxyqueuosine reductase QueH [Clostridia bacterium]|nr:epoxyqueuosine reductase QueH [Clostridia bacterium]